MYIIYAIATCAGAIMILILMHIAIQLETLQEHLAWQN